MDIILTPHQQIVGDKILDLFRQGHKRVVLQGSAGCGKTVLASWLISVIAKDRTVNTSYNNGLVYVTAPTNKALAVLQGKIEAHVEFKTIHSALKLSRYIDRNTGRETFIRSKSNWKQDDFTHCKFCVIDESSMLSSQFIGGVEDKEKGKFYPGYLDDLKIPILFIGDEKQLNPVGEEDSPAFHQGWPTVELTEIIRQGDGNPIIELSRNLDLIFKKQPKVVSGKGYVYDNNKAMLIDSLAEVNGTDELKYLSWANADVDEMNGLVRRRRYGNPRKIEKGETIVFNAPFGTFYTNKEEKVVDVDVYVDNISIPRYDTVFDRNNVPVTGLDKIKLKFYKVNGIIDIPHEDSQLIFNQLCTAIQQGCKSKGWDWRGHFWFNEQFANITYNHALTVHKSQGSTYKEAITNIGNIAYNKNLKERTRMLYTAVTRSSHLLILNNVR